MKALIIIVCLVILAPIWMPLGLALLGFIVNFWWLFAILLASMLFGGVKLDFRFGGGGSRYKRRRLNHDELMEKYKGRRVEQNNSLTKPDNWMV